MQDENTAYGAGVWQGVEMVSVLKLGRMVK
jgi:hypothetical protein